MSEQKNIAKTSENKAPEVITLDHFIKRFKRAFEGNSLYCFILGAGASRTSGIKTGYELAKIWWDDIKKYEGEADAEKDWDADVDIEMLKKNPGEYYHQIYARRFKLSSEDGSNYLKDIMNDKNVIPSYGYSVLAQILTSSRHNLVITTNFDSLVEDSVKYYTNTKSHVIGHELQARYSAPIGSKFPTILKVHRDLFFEPLNTTRETKTLHKETKKALADALKNYIPLVIGYGGNDGGLMQFLEENIPPKRKMIWFYYKDLDTLKIKAKKLIDNEQVVLVPIDGFDELMFDIQEALGYKNLTQEVHEKNSSINKRYDEQYRSLLIKKKLGPHEKGFQEMVKVAEEFEKKNEFYKAAIFYDEIIKIDPDTLDVFERRPYFNALNISAHFFQFTHPDYDKAETCYIKHIRHYHKFGGDSSCYTAYARFLRNIRHDYDGAELYYQKGVDASNYVCTRCNYAEFLCKRQKFDKARELYQKIINDSSYGYYPNPCVLYKYAHLLAYHEKNFDGAKEFFLSAIDKSEGTGLSDAQRNYAEFLEIYRKEYDKSEEYHEKSIKDHGDAALNSSVYTSYANFLIDVRRNIFQAKELLSDAMKKCPDQFNIILANACFLRNFGENCSEEAGKLFIRAIELDPNSIAALREYAYFIERTSNNYDQAETYYRKALYLDPDDGSALVAYASFLERIRQDYESAEDKYRRVVDAQKYNMYARLMLACFCSCRGQQEEAKKTLSKYDLNITREKEHLVYYIICLLLKMDDGNVLEKLNRILGQGIRHFTWDFENLLQCDLFESHPERDELKNLISRIKAK